MIDDLSSGNEQVLMIITKAQSPFSTDGWGRRWNEDSIDNINYLVKKRERQPDKPMTEFTVLFDAERREYHVPIYSKRDLDRDGDVYVVAKEYVAQGEQPEIISDPLQTIEDAFWYGYNKLIDKIDADYMQYQHEQKKKRRSEAAKKAAKTRNEQNKSKGEKDGGH